MQLIDSIKQEINKVNPNHNKCLLAFSAGPDSVFLLHQFSLLYKDNLKDKIELAYVNYHDSQFVDKEEEIVNYYTGKFNLTLNKIDAYYDGKSNFENWARDIRYGFFSNIVKNKNLYAVYTAHQKTDDIETYLLQKQRKNLPLHYGLLNQSNIANIKLLRVMLDIEKDDISKMLDDENIRYYDDITNKNLLKERNKFRSYLSTLSLDEKNNIITEKNKLNQELDKLYSSFNQKHDVYKFSFYNCLSENNKKRLCHYLIDKKTTAENKNENYYEKDITACTNNAFNFLNKCETSTLKLNNDLYIYKTKEYFFIDVDLSNYKREMIISKPGIYNYSILTLDFNNLLKFTNKLSFPFTIRSYKANDQISTDLKEKDVYTFLKKQQIPPFLIDLYPLFVKDNKIVYVPFIKDIKDNKIPIKVNL